MRRRFTETDKQRYLAELKDSGGTPWSFARQAGISAATLYRWMKRRPASSPQFVQLVRERRSRPAAPVSSGHLSVRVGQALVQVEPGFDPELLRAIVGALGEQGSP